MQINLILISIYIPIENRTQSGVEGNFNNERKKTKKNLWKGLVFSNLKLFYVYGHTLGFQYPPFSSPGLHKEKSKLLGADVI